MAEKDNISKKIKQIISLLKNDKINEGFALANNNLKFFYELAIQIGNMGNYIIAEKIFDRLVKINPNYAQAWCNKGVALGKRGKYYA